jgi:hypothetical protein
LVACIINHRGMKLPRLGDQVLLGVRSDPVTIMRHGRQTYSTAGFTRKRTSVKEEKINQLNYSTSKTIEVNSVGQEGAKGRG